MPSLDADRIIEANIPTQVASRALLGSNGESRCIAQIQDVQYPMVAQGHTGTAQCAAAEIDDRHGRQDVGELRFEPDTHGPGVAGQGRIPDGREERGCGTGEEIAEKSTTTGGCSQIDRSFVPFRDFDTLDGDACQASLATGGVKIGQA